MLPTSFCCSLFFHSHLFMVPCWVLPDIRHRVELVFESKRVNEMHNNKKRKGLLWTCWMLLGFFVFLLVSLFPCLFAVCCCCFVVVGWNWLYLLRQWKKELPFRYFGLCREGFWVILWGAHVMVYHGSFSCGWFFSVGILGVMLEVLGGCWTVKALKRWRVQPLGQRERFSSGLCCASPGLIRPSSLRKRWIYKVPLRYVWL